MPQSQLQGRSVPLEGDRGVNAGAIVSFALALGVSLLQTWTKAGSRRKRRTLTARRVQEPLGLSDFKDLRSRFEESGTAVEVRKVIRAFLFFVLVFYKCFSQRASASRVQTLNAIGSALVLRASTSSLSDWHLS